VRVAVEAFLTRIIARLNFDEADVQPRIAIGRELQRARHVNRANDLFRFQIVSDGMAGAHLHANPRDRRLAALPGLGRRPRAALGGASQRGQVYLCFFGAKF